MQPNNNFCYFAGYTKGMIPLKEFRIDEDKNTIQMKFNLPPDRAFLSSGYLQLSGLLCRITSYNKQNFTVSTTVELAKESTILPLFKGKELSLGVLLDDVSAEKQHYPLQPSNSFQAILTKKPKKIGNLVKLKFQCGLNDDFETIAKGSDPYAGIAGSSVFLKKIKIDKNNIRFTIFAWPETQKITELNESLKAGTKVGFNLPRKI